MPTAEDCRRMAEDAERLAGVVSYERDKARLRQQAEAWRRKAQALEAEAQEAQGEPTSDDKNSPLRGIMKWLKQPRS